MNRGAPVTKETVHVKGRLSGDLIEELQVILREDYGKDLKLDDVEGIADSLVEYFDFLAMHNHRLLTEAGQRDNLKTEAMA